MCCGVRLWSGGGVVRCGVRWVLVVQKCGGEEWRGERGGTVVWPSEGWRCVVWLLVLSACERGCVGGWVLWFGRQRDWSGRMRSAGEGAGRRRSSATIDARSWRYEIYREGFGWASRVEGSRCVLVVERRWSGVVRL